VTSLAIACNSGATSGPNVSVVTTHVSTGVIKAIDPKTRAVTIDHKDIPDLMSAMTMTWPVSDPALVTGLTPGDTVAFEVERSGTEIRFVRITKTGRDASVSGSEIFASNCADCHGAKGEGEKKGIPLIKGHALAHTEQEFTQRVLNGKENKMPAFREKLSDEDVAAVVKYVREELQKGADRNAAHKH